jgi:predicted Kef-type K+ transport protein
MLFFVAVRMLFDPAILWCAPLLVSAVLLHMLVGKSSVAMGVRLAAPGKRPPGARR